MGLFDVVTAWRAAERELAPLTEGDPGFDRVNADLAGLRALHHRLFDERAGRSVGSQILVVLPLVLVAAGP